MAGKGKRFTFHGAYGKKADAKRKERAVGGFIERKVIKGHLRFVVMKGKRKRG